MTDAPSFPFDFIVLTAYQYAASMASFPAHPSGGHTATRTANDSGGKGRAAAQYPAAAIAVCGGAGRTAQ